MPSLPNALLVVPTFGGSALWGADEIRTVGPAATTRALRETLPGVSGYRIYLLNGGVPDTKIWTISGRIFATDGIAIEQFLNQVIDRYRNGRLFTFISPAGINYSSCELKDFRMNPPIMRCLMNGDYFSTVVVQGTIEQAAG